MWTVRVERTGQFMYFKAASRYDALFLVRVMSNAGYPAQIMEPII